MPLFFKKTARRYLASGKARKFLILQPLFCLFVLSFTGVCIAQVDVQQESKSSNPVTSEETLIVRMFGKDLDTALIEAALEKTIDQGPYKLISLESDPMFASGKTSVGRALRYLEEGDILHLAALDVTQENLDKYIPIRTPVSRGSLGFRLFLIHKDRQSEFSNVETLDDIRKRFVAGFGSDWGEFNIFEENNLKVFGYYNAAQIPKMIAKKRIDYFPLGAEEVWDPLWKSLPELTVEKNLAFYYVFPRYFFINKKHPGMAKRIDEGLHEVLKDGT
ncbi:MAG: hypothetical protein KAJ14_03160, partial [Candidatus Omnitrophica bacterium]|nr:hypothetical protein [Candidatus Omnitrophota bacterium]